MITKDITLLIISHTDHYYNAAKHPCGWTSTVKELDFLAQHVKRVIHLAVLHPHENAPQSVSPYAAKNIDFVAMPRYGGSGLRNKLRILGVIPGLLHTVSKLLRESDFFQFRAPTSIGVFLIPYLTYFSRAKGWHKYAGNWMQPNMPLSYKIQKWMLENMQKRPVTINGNWPGQKEHCHTFENPCLYEADLKTYQAETIHKSFEGPYEACFVGRLEDAKGVARILELMQIPGMPQKLKHIHLVGDGPKREAYEAIAQASPIRFIFHGFLSRDQVFNIYKQSHFFFLPSDSEGFPKVIAEAAAFGCLPVVSDVSSIGQYVHDGNGFLWRMDEARFADYFSQINLEPAQLKKKQKNSYQLAEKFTFERYLEKLQSNVWRVNR